MKLKAEKVCRVAGLGVNEKSRREGKNKRLEGKSESVSKNIEGRKKKREYSEQNREEKWNSNVKRSVEDKGKV